MPSALAMNEPIVGPVFLVNHNDVEVKKLWLGIVGAVSCLPLKSQRRLGSAQCTSVGLTSIFPLATIHNSITILIMNGFL